MTSCRFKPSKGLVCSYVIQSRSLLGSKEVNFMTLPSSPHGCTEGSCYPATGNLLIGRAVNLTATSTCGLNGPERYCIVSHLQVKKCFECNSQHPYDPNVHSNSHRIENVIYLTDSNGVNTWWQSVHGVYVVSIRLNLEAEFHFTHLIMKFKTFRPAALVIERSADFGRTWRPYRYYASNCTRTFPSIPANGLHHVNDIICEERYSDIEPSTNGEVIYKVLDPAIPVKDPYRLDIQELLRITNLRINFTKLNTLGDDLLDRRPEVLQKYYYAIYELVVRGSCFCYGHASECAPVPGIDAREIGMHILSESCTHLQHSKSQPSHLQCLNCERCRNFHNDLPWRPAEAENPHTCRACDCDPVGSLEGGVCDTHTDFEMGMIAGQCRCKVNVKGTRCDDCKEGYYGLSQNDPLGCQPCNCDPRGIIVMGAPCDQISGDCSCKRYVTGRYCNQCLPEYWGLSNDLAGCRPCDCDFGGAFNNRCMMETGQCDCRRHLIGRQCSDVQPGYFCAPLDFYKYEAEDATGHSPADPVLTVHRERTLSHMVTWTGPGFSRVKDGAGLVFTIDNIPYAMEYDIMIRYEPEVCEYGENMMGVESKSKIKYKIHLLLHVLSCSMCSYRYIQMPRPFCFEPSNRYVVTVRFQRHGATHRHLTAFILIDSLVLIPKYTELPGFQGNTPESEQRQEEMIRYMCLDSFMITPMPALAEMCSKLICSISSIIHDGALPCECDPQGSLSGECDVVGGQCRCKPNVIGRRCDQCAPGTYGFGVSGCTACDCHSDGSLSHQCDPVTGQCQCRQGATGRQCSDCQPGQWGFPSCTPCQCNGHADLCDPRTGECRGCRDFTAGHLCERCMDTFFGNPALGSGQHCRPCPCPNNPNSDNFNALSCQVDHTSDQIMCNCKQGYMGLRCDQCAPGYYGNPEQPGGQCFPCECNGNIDTQDPESCDPRTGECIKCLYHTDGPSCAQCQNGYYGNALAHDCRRCTCVTAGTLQSACSDGHCDCDRQTGACPCREHVVGHNCDQCAPNYWNFGQDRGCEPCNCNSQHALGSHCNMFTGQCHCHSGFGGKQCTECELFHWGDPREQCHECNCNPEGAEISQCDRLTGACECREGATGLQCNQCARGFTGIFPKCIQCHPCFQLWDDAVCQIRRDLDHIQSRVQEILKGGIIPGAGDARIKELEGKLKQVKDLIITQDRDRVYQLIGQSIDDLRWGNSSLSFLLVFLTDQFEKVKQYYQESLEAEMKCNASVFGPMSPLEESNKIRARTENLLDETENDINRNVAAHNKSLNDLQKQAHDLHKQVNHLSDQVSSVVNGSCPDSRCGGAGCHDDQGNRVCGGVGCSGTVGTSVAALNDARNVTDSLNTASKELQKVSKKLQDIAAMTQNLKNQTINTLEKANKLSKELKESNKNLTEFIEKIKNFLTEEGADPESIEKVAQEVLSITLPLNRTVLDKMIAQIKESLSNIGNIEGIVNQTTLHTTKVKELLDAAKQAKRRAEEVKDMTNITKEALKASGKAIEKAQAALKEAHNNLNSTRNATAEVQNPGTCKFTGFTYFLSSTSPMSTFVHFTSVLFI
uniref:Laminin, beta 2-like n=1 Tax=Oreochromis niloticus TaxID=8128 RepID=A0A669DIR8_ORENI